MKVLTADLELVHELDPLPEGTTTVTEAADDVEFAVIGPELAGQLPTLLAQLPGLRVLQSTQAGVDWLLPLVPPGITVCSASGAHDIAVSEWVVGALLTMRRRLLDFYDLQRQGHWESNVNSMTAAAQSPFPPIDDLDGRTVLILGYGSIGRAVGVRLAPFGAHIVGVAADQRPGVHSLQELPSLLPDADAVIVLLPLTPATHHVVDDTFLSAMKPGAILVNASRGPVVDTGALLRAVSVGQVRAAIDVTEPEPLVSGHPLWRAPNILITPHVAGVTERWQQRAYRLAGDQVRRYAAGEALVNIATE